jgi:hypothetical protein
MFYSDGSLATGIKTLNRVFEREWLMILNAKKKFGRV